MPDKNFTSVYGQLQGYGRIIGTVGADAKESVFDPIGCLLADPWLVFAGVCFSVLVQYGMGRYTIWIRCGILLFVLVWMSF